MIESIIDLSVIAYFVGLNSVYGLYMVLSFMELGKANADRLVEVDHQTLSHDLPPVTIVSPAYNEEKTIVASIRALLHLSYPNVEVVAVNDGSTDDTLKVLMERFDLVPVNVVIRSDVITKPVRGIYQSRTVPNLLVIDKENGGKADALNVGLNVCRTPLLCCVDADSLLSRKALLRLVQPFVRGRANTVASGGTIRIVNGSDIKDGLVREIKLPNSWLVRFQVVEYLRAFLFARLGLNRLGGNLIISGAMGLFSREVLVEVGGYESDTVGEDMELIVRIHRYMRDAGRPYEITFVPDPVCYTEAPDDWRILGGQRDRWQRGLSDSLWRHRGMMFNPRYGIVGLFTFPAFVMFELLGPVVELFGYFWLLSRVIFGQVGYAVGVLFFFVAFLLGLLLSLQALVLDDLNLDSYRGRRSRWLLVLTAGLENFGYRQFTLWYRIKGILKFLFGVKTWGKMRRKGFDSAEA